MRRILKIFFLLLWGLPFSVACQVAVDHVNPIIKISHSESFPFYEIIGENENDIDSMKVNKGFIFEQIKKYEDLHGKNISYDKIFVFNSNFEIIEVKEIETISIKNHDLENPVPSITLKKNNFLQNIGQ